MNSDLLPQEKKQEVLPSVAWILTFALRAIYGTIVLVSTDVPDEWYQSVEVAYWLVFGRGELTWEWKSGIRSFLYPAPYAALFWIMKVLGLDTPDAVAWAPRVVAAAIATLIDWATVRLAMRVSGNNTAVGRLAFIVSVSSWYGAFLGQRMLSNSAEALTVLLAATASTDSRGDAFYMWAGLGCAIRPTTLLPLMPLAIMRLRCERGAWLPFITRGIVWVAAWLGFAACVDYAFYGRWLCTALNFALFNVVEGHSAVFGTHPWYWYLVLFPVVCGPVAVVLLCGWPRRAAAERAQHLIWSIGFTAMCLSCLPHKELRFLYPILPLCHVALVLHWWRVERAWRRRKTLALVIGIVGIVTALIASVTWQTGPVAAMSSVRRLGFRDEVVHVLAGCHATPGMTHGHQLARLVHNTCELKMSGDTREPTEHHMFIAAPDAFVAWLYEGHDSDATTAAAPPANAEGYRRFEPQPSAEDMRFSRQGLIDLMRLTVPRRSRRFPKAFLVYSTDSKSLEQFLNRNGFHKQLEHIHTPGWISREPTFMELWIRK